MPKNTKSKSKKTKSGWRFSLSRRNSLLVVMLLFGVIGSITLYRTFAYDRITVSAPPVDVTNAGTNSSYWVATEDGGVFSLGGAKFHGSMGGKKLNQKITAFAKRAQSDGYWLLGGDGGVFAFGGAKYLTSASPLKQTPTASTYKAIVSTPSGAGYWIIAKGGQIFAYGDAATYSKTPTSGFSTINASKTKQNTAYGGLPGLPSGGIVAAARTQSGRGLYLLSSAGNIYSYGDAVYRGWTSTLPSGVTATDIAANGSGSTSGYYIVTSKGKVHTFKNMTKRGDASAITLNGAITGMACTPGCKGYWLVGRDGGIFTYGDAVFKGALKAPTTTTAPKPTTTAPTPTTPTMPKLTPEQVKYIQGATSGTGVKLTPEQARYIAGVTATQASKPANWTPEEAAFIKAISQPQKGGAVSINNGNSGTCNDPNADKRPDANRCPIPSQSLGYNSSYQNILCSPKCINTATIPVTSGNWQICWYGKAGGSVRTIVKLSSSGGYKQVLDEVSHNSTSRKADCFNVTFDKGGYVGYQITSNTHNLLYAKFYKK